jgi:hypothetical protein
MLPSAYALGNITGPGLHITAGMEELPDDNIHTRVETCRSGGINQ